jgi:hypothetical protein
MEEQVGYGNSKSVVDFEQKYPELAYEFQQIQKEQYELFASKMMDYGLSKHCSRFYSRKRRRH